MEHTPVPWYVAYSVKRKRPEARKGVERKTMKVGAGGIVNHWLTETCTQYTAAAKSNSLDSASKALASLGQVLKSDPKLGQILHAPTLSSKDKSDIIAELEKHTGGQDKAKIVVNFMETLAENNRLGLLQGICEKFGQLMGASKGEMDLIITSAQVRHTVYLCGCNVLTPT